MMYLFTFHFYTFRSVPPFSGRSISSKNDGKLQAFRLCTSQNQQFDI